jgi:VWFA-related protein
VLGIPPEDQPSFRRRLLLGEGGVFNPEMIGLSVYFINQMEVYKPISGSDVEVKIDDAKSTVDLVIRLVPRKKTSSDRTPHRFPSGMVAGFAQSQAKTPADQPTIRTEVALVNVVFSARDRSNRAAAGLKADDFLVFEDRQPQKIEFFSDLERGADVPLTIALLIDTSGSVKNKLEYEKDTAAEFFKSVLRKNKDLALIIQFDSDVNLVQDFTDDPNRLIGALDTLQAGNSTSLYDALFLAVDEKLKHESGRKVVVVITDGEDTSSKLRKEAAITAAQKHDVLIYGIGVRGDLGTNFGVLKRFAEETGGLFFSPRARFAEIQEAFRAIGEDLKGQYSLAYSSTNQKRDGSFRAIEIRSKISGIRIRARKGYYAPREERQAGNRSGVTP